MFASFLISWLLHTWWKWGFPGDSEVKVSAHNAGDLGSILGSGRSPGEGTGNPLQYSCLENPMDGGACWAIQSTGSQSQAPTERLHFHFHILMRSGAFRVVWPWTHFHILKVFLLIYLILFWWLHIILWVDCITNYLIIYLGSIFFTFTNSKIKSNMNHLYKLKFLEVGLLSKSKHVLTIWMATAKLTNCYTRL